MRIEEFISKDYINDTIRPFTPNDGLYSACLYEVCDIDVRKILGCDVAEELMGDGNLSEELEDIIENGQLIRGIGYLVYSRALRTSTSTITKYGATNKSSDYSNPTDNQKIVSDSDYYKEVGVEILKKYKDQLNKDTCCKKHTGAGWYNSKIIGD